VPLDGVQAFFKGEQTPQSKAFHAALGPPSCANMVRD